MDTQELWKQVLGDLELQVSKPNFASWFKNTFISAVDQNHITVSVQNDFTKTWLESKYKRDILKSIQRATGDAVRDISFAVSTKSTPASPQMEVSAPGVKPAGTHTVNDLQFTSATEIAKPDEATSLNGRYTFETYIVGRQNEFAHAAALAVASHPGDHYNPLFIYGDVGLGKTHLLQAVGNRILQTNKAKRVLYVTSEKFTTEFITAVRTGRAREFKDTYRGVDVLIVDDIQFFTGKMETQEEFFHTFNALHQQNKQIILSADRAPTDITGLEARLLSRFQSGMTADISSPDFETRMAILDAKCRERQWSMPPDATRTVAEAIQSNVRELEGALNKIIAVHQLKNQVPSKESIEPILRSLRPAEQTKTVTPKEILSVVAEYFDVTTDDLVGKSREKRLAFPRQIIMYILREDMRHSFPSIGNQLGGRDHTTAMHAHEKISRLVESDSKLAHDLKIIRQRIYTRS